MEKKSFDFEAFKKSAQERLRKGDGLLGKEGVDLFLTLDKLRAR